MRYRKLMNWLKTLIFRVPREQCEDRFTIAKDEVIKCFRDCKISWEEYEICMGMLTEWEG